MFTLVFSGAVLAQSAETAIHCGSLLDPERGTAGVDVSKGFCLPGPIDVHDHLTADPKDAGYSSPGVSAPRSTVTGARNAHVTLLAPLAFGTDGGVYPHGDNAKQFATMVEWGAKPIDAIRTSTVEAARLLNQEGKAGVVKPVQGLQ